MAEEAIDLLLRSARLFSRRIQTFLHLYLDVFEGVAVIVPLELELTLVLYALHFRNPVHRDLALVEP